MSVEFDEESDSSGRLSQNVVPAKVAAKTKQFNRQVLIREGVMRLTKFIFKRQTQLDGSVTAGVSWQSEGMDEGKIGDLHFESARLWSKFIGAIQHGALQIPDLDVELMAMAPAKEPTTAPGVMSKEGDSSAKFK